MASKRIKTTEDELIARVDQELHAAQGYMGGKLSEQRRKAMQYYLGRPEGDLAPPEVEGRSSYVSSDVADTVEWMLPSLLRIFTASDRVVQVTPKKPGMEQAAEDATDYLNWIFQTQNDGFECLYSMIKDALIFKAGVLKIWWEDKKEESREEYEGLSDIELAQLLEDGEVEPIEHEARPDESDIKRREQAISQIISAVPPGDANAAMMAQQQVAAIQSTPAVMLHDVVVKRSKNSAQVRVEPVPPEEFFISRHAKKIKSAPFVAHVREWIVSDLRAEGYKIEDGELPVGDSFVEASAERDQRNGYEDSFAPDDYGSDPSMRRVWVSESYLRADVDGDGIAEWRRVLKCGSKVFENVECDGPPFVSVTPVPMPHEFFGLSIADLAMEVMRQKTQVGRAILDNLYLQVNGRYYAVENQVNLDDLLTSRPGGVVRIKSLNAVGPLNQGMANLGDSHMTLEWLEQQRESRTGWTRQSAGPGENVINKTATEVATVTNREDMRVELIARIFAETGIKDLFVKILELVCKYQQQPAEFRLNGRWLAVNPREWRNQFDLTINVGLGSNDPTTKVGMLTQLMQMQGALSSAGTGIVGPKQAYNSAREMVKALGYKDADMFLLDPGDGPPPQPPDPSQAQAAETQAKIQGEMEIEKIRAQRDKEIDTHRQLVQAQQAQQESELKAHLEGLKMQHSAELKRMDGEHQEKLAAIREANALQIARENNATRIEVALISARKRDDHESSATAHDQGGNDEQ